MPKEHPGQQSMTLTEVEFTQKWTQISSVLSRLEGIIDALVKESESVKESEVDREQAARMHAVVAYVMTHIEDGKS